MEGLDGSLDSWLLLKPTWVITALWGGSKPEEKILLHPLCHSAFQMVLRKGKKKMMGLSGRSLDKWGSCPWKEVKYFSWEPWVPVRPVKRLLCKEQYWTLFFCFPVWDGIHSRHATTCCLSWSLHQCLCMPCGQKSFQNWGLIKCLYWGSWSMPGISIFLMLSSYHRCVHNFKWKVLIELSQIS